MRNGIRNHAQSQAPHQSRPVASVRQAAMCNRLTNFWTFQFRTALFNSAFLPSKETSLKRLLRVARAEGHEWLATCAFNFSRVQTQCLEESLLFLHRRSEFVPKITQNCCANPVSAWFCNFGGRRLSLAWSIAWKRQSHTHHLNKALCGPKRKPSADLSVKFCKCQKHILATLKIPARCCCSIIASLFVCQQVLSQAFSQNQTDFSRHNIIRSNELNHTDIKYVIPCACLLMLRCFLWRGRQHHHFSREKRGTLVGVQHTRQKTKARGRGWRSESGQQDIPISIYGIALVGFKNKQRCTAIQRALKNCFKKIVVRNAFCIPVYIFKNIATCIGFRISDSNTYQLKKNCIKNWATNHGTNAPRCDSLARIWGPTSVLLQREIRKTEKDNIILFRVQPALKKNTLAPWLILLPSFAYG